MSGLGPAGPAAATAPPGPPAAPAAPATPLDPPAAPVGAAPRRVVDIGLEPPAGPAAVLTDLTVAYSGRVALSGVSATVPAGSTVALIGPNGAGKSTLIGSLLGLVRPAAGRVEVLGRSPARARREIGYVPQADTVDLDFPVSVGAVVLMGRYRRVGWLARPKAADRERAAAALAAVGLADRARDTFGTLSGGQRQRVLLARAIAAEPRLLLLDEPFNGLDVVSQDALLTALTALRADGVAVVLATHDLALAREQADLICLLNRRQFAFGPTEQVLTGARLAEAYGSSALTFGPTALVVTGG